MLKGSQGYRLPALAILQEAREFVQPLAFKKCELGEAGGSATDCFRAASAASLATTDAWLSLAVEGPQGFGDGAVRQLPVEVGPAQAAALGASASLGSDCLRLNGGTLFQGKKFEWIRGQLLGRGAMGSVWMATDRHTGQKMAVKEVLLDTTEEGEKRAPLCVDREVSLYRNQLLSQIGAFDEPDIATYSRQVLEALHYLHTRKPSILHRDVKTANILLGVDGIVKLADFGCSKRASGNAVHTLRGHPAHFVPTEQKEMLTTRPPWGHFETNVAAIIHVATSKELLPKMESRGLGRQLVKGFMPRLRAQERPSARYWMLTTANAGKRFFESWDAVPTLIT
ncbi:Mitogen-activated protein kinase kinase kinase A [Symbiodinium microadriaticum]|uniref:Mitogen-activated protein kinase kinase kinase A n=1 Tax=Symbiodinium microadriaticum TaxID=2951 RepID=A0A1Q9CNN5_SYMMI|nr:Mitogen-activated protein kinase kinase kinase A [Symbiodinium microadriaticum]